MEIKILGPGCAKCRKTQESIQEVLDENKVTANVEKVSDMMEIASFGIFSTPAVIIDNDVKCTGKVPGKIDIQSWLGV